MTNYRGRATRAEFWWIWLTGLIIYLVIGTVVELLILAAPAAAGAFAFLYLALFAAVTVVSLPVAVRRIHDSGQLGALVLVPIVNLVLLLMPSDPHPNRYGLPRHLPGLHAPR